MGSFFDSTASSASGSASASASLPCSPSSSVPGRKYDVFISFRAKDTRTTFIGYLHDALRREKIKTYMDEEDIKIGEEIPSALIRAIEESMVFVVVFSENYADSSWCLDELVHILKCRREYRCQVVPVFYKVDPSDVYNQRGNYATVFSSSQKCFEHKLDSWRAALREAASLAGRRSQDTRTEVKLVKKIVKDVLKILNGMSPREGKNTINNMRKKLTPIKDITNGRKRWTTKVLVCEKYNERISQDKKYKYQRIVLIDYEGTYVQATLFDNSIELYKESLALHKSYYISNALVKPIEKRYGLFTNKYQWIINSSTLIEEVPELENKNVIISLPACSFVPFNSLHQYINDEALIDILAVAADIQSPRTIQTQYGPTHIQEIVLINEEKSELRLTIWTHFFDDECATIANTIATKPIVLAKRIRVVLRHRISLTTTPQTCLLVEPELPEVDALRNWRDSNQNSLHTAAIGKDNASSSLITKMPPAEKIDDISVIQNASEKSQYYWIKASIAIENLDQNFWYMACEKCHKSTGADFNELFKCNSCGRENVKAIRRCYVQVHLNDSSGILHATMFGKNAETFLNCPSTKLKEETTEDGILEIQNFINISPTKVYIIKLKASKDKYSRELKYNYIVEELLTDTNDTAS